MAKETQDSPRSFDFSPGASDEAIAVFMAQFNPEIVAVIEESLLHPNPFDLYDVLYRPGLTWTYVLKQMNVTRWQRHHLLHGIAETRRQHGGKVNEEQTAAILADVLAGKYDTT